MLCSEENPILPRMCGHVGVPRSARDDTPFDDTPFKDDKALAKTEELSDRSSR